MKKEDRIGTAYKTVADKILRMFFKRDRSAVERITVDGYQSTECLVEIESKFNAAMALLSQKLYEEVGVTIPVNVRQAILHAPANDPLIVRTSNMIHRIGLGLTEKKKAEIAYQMMRAVSRQHQEDYSYEYLKKLSYEPPLPNPWSIKNYKFDPINDMMFMPIELLGWEMLNHEFFPFAQVVMGIIGIAPLYSEAEQEHLRQQELIGVDLHNQFSIEEHILKNRMSYSNAIDAVFRHGSFPARLAKKIYEANKKTA